MVAHYDIFRHHLFMKFPAYGHALWEPDPGNLYPAVKVGDVGYIRRGKFRRLFNVLLPAEDKSHEDFGTPEYHEPLTPGLKKHIEIGKLGRNNYCSANVIPLHPSNKAMGSWIVRFQYTLTHIFADQMKSPKSLSTARRKKEPC